MRHLSVRAAQLLKPLRTFLQHTLVNLQLITCQSVGYLSRGGRGKAELWAGVEVVEFTDLIKTAETGQTLQVLIQHLYTGERSIFLWISTLRVWERVSFQLAFSICANLYRRNINEKSHSLMHDGI